MFGDSLISLSGSLNPIDRGQEPFTLIYVFFVLFCG